MNPASALNLEDGFFCLSLLLDPLGGTLLPGELLPCRPGNISCKFLSKSVTESSESSSPSEDSLAADWEIPFPSDHEIAWS